MTTGRTVWVPKVPTLKGTEVSFSHIQCFLYLVYSSINVSIFHIAWLGTFWTDLVSVCICVSFYMMCSVFRHYIERQSKLCIKSFRLVSTQLTSFITTPKYRKYINKNSTLYANFLNDFIESLDLLTYPVTDLFRITWLLRGKRLISLYSWFLCYYLYIRMISVLETCHYFSDKTKISYCSKTHLF